MRKVLQKLNKYCKIGVSNNEVIMSVKTNNIYGKILISDRTIRKYVARVASDCYGIVDFVPGSFFGKLMNKLGFFTQDKGVKVRASGDRIFIDVSVMVKYGVSIKAVVEALKEAINYKVERFTGMIVDTVNVSVVGVTL